MTAGQKKGEACGKKQKMWHMMRGLKTFTYDDIVRLTGYNIKIVFNYLSRLYKAGYLRVESKENLTGKRPRRVFRLIKNTGPLAPFETVFLYDPNLKKVVQDERTLREKDSR